MASKKATSSRMAVQNAIKTLVANIRFASVDKPVKTMVVTSATPNEGKSTISVNLSMAIASSGKKVLLVECDMRNRSLADMLGTHSRNGLYSALSGLVELEDAVVSTQQPNLYFLDSEPNIPNPADILASKRFQGLISQLEDRYDYVIFDTPPVGTFVDAAEISTLVDGTLLVVREDFTKRNDLMTAYDQLKKAEAHVLGVVLNCCESDQSEYYYAYYNQSGKRVRTSNDAPAMAEVAQQPQKAAPAQQQSGTRFARR